MSYDEPLMTPAIHHHHIRKSTPPQMSEIAILRLLLEIVKALSISAP